MVQLGCGKMPGPAGAVRGLHRVDGQGMNQMGWCKVPLLLLFSAKEQGVDHNRGLGQGAGAGWARAGRAGAGQAAAGSPEWVVLLRLFSAKKQGIDQMGWCKVPLLLLFSAKEQGVDHHRGLGRGAGAGLIGAGRAGAGRALQSGWCCCYCCYCFQPRNKE